MKTFALGDVHGAYKALVQVLERSNFNKEEDRLICLGDVADGWGEVPECFDELLSIKNLIYINGNHDVWCLEWMNTGYAKHIWTSQGGKATLDSYALLLASGDTRRQVRHQNLLEQSPYYFIDEENRLYVHGGFDWHKPIEDQFGEYLIWDRHMWITANMWHRNKNDKHRTMGGYKEVFIGHTTTSRIDPLLKPVHACNVWNLDQGAGWEGKLTLMNVDTHEYFQSDIVKDLYPDEIGR